MDGIKVKKNRALLNKMVTAITNGKDLNDLQEEWLLDYIDALFKERSSKKEWWDYRQKDVISKLMEMGLPETSITDTTPKARRGSYYYGRDDLMSENHKIKFSNYNVAFNNYSGGSSRDGSYRGIHARFFGTYHSVDLRFMPAATAASTLMELDTLIPQWIETYWPEFVLEAQKSAKMKSINENTIEMLIKTKLTGKDIKYHLEKQKIRVKVLFNIGNDMQIEWFISHKSFMQQIETVIDAVTTIKKVVEETGTSFTAKKLDKNIHWQ